MQLTPVQQAQIAKYALANGNKAANGNGNDKFSSSHFAHGTNMHSRSTRHAEN